MEHADIQKAIEIVKKGGIIIYPTDTAFGVGCRVSDEKAVKRLFAIRKRPELKAVPVLVDSLEMAKKYFSFIPQQVIDKLIIPYWPGALTIVLPCKTENVPKLVRGGRNTIGIRIPNNATISQIIAGVGDGIVGCSANFSGGPTPYSFAELDNKLVKQVDFVVSGETIHTYSVSTVIDCSQTPWKILRQGEIKIKLPHSSSNYS